MGIERRRSDRIHAKLPVRVRFGKRETVYEGTCLNLNERGMFAHLPSLPNPGERVLVEFELGEEGHTIRARAEQAWILPVLVGTTQAIGLGLRFLDLDEKGREQIRSISQRLRKVVSGGD